MIGVAGLPQTGDTGSDPVTGAPYVVCRADSNSAWIAHSQHGGDVYNPTAVCQKLGYQTVNSWGGTCGTVCGYCGQSNYEFFDGAGGNAQKLQYTVHWQCQGELHQDEHTQDIPEFGIIGAALLFAGAGIFIARRRATL